MKRTALVIGTTVALVAGTAGTAQAAPGRISSWNDINSQASVTFRVERNSDGYKYSVSVPVGGLVGEGTGRAGDAEPEAFFVRAGRCGNWALSNQSYDGTWTRGGTSGVWVSIYAGETRTTDYATKVREWDC